MPKDTQLAGAAAGMCIVNHQSEQSLSLCLLAPLGSGLDDPFYIILDEGQGNESIRVLNNFYLEKKESRFREGKELACSCRAIPDSLLQSRANSPMLAPKGYFPTEISKGPSASWDLGGENSQTGQFVLTGRRRLRSHPHSACWQQDAALEWDPGYGDARGRL